MKASLLILILACFAAVSATHSQKIQRVEISRPTEITVPDRGPTTPAGVTRENDRGNSANPQTPPQTSKPITSAPTLPEQGLTDESVVALRQLQAAKWLKNLAVGSSAYLAWEKIMGAFKVYNSKKKPEALIAVFDVFDKEAWDDLARQLKGATNLDDAIGKNIDDVINQLDLKLRDYSRENRNTRQIEQELRFWRHFGQTINQAIIVNSSLDFDLDDTPEAEINID